MSGQPLNAKSRRRMKARLAERDGGRCWYCGIPFGEDLAAATLDHLVPRSQVYSWAAAALVLACGPCNAAKADVLPQALLRPPIGRWGPGLVPLAS